MIKAGQIYDIWFPFKPPILPGQQPGKYRPALILSVSEDGTATAVAIKITSSGPSKIFPLRIPIWEWAKAGLDNESFVEIDSEIPIRFTGDVTPRGKLEDFDFNRVLVEYTKYQRRIRRGGTTT
ncbi:type II toxin-antitoxin system PemK/MazF family toxin [Mesobacillus maritimus]|uniref:Type II toxin-antitoxin system PemK/MazF family toxin n=1 Tax=Mesobacillus maritimus TaxID=1643336 RepID=A0ABS7K798_9BACI|nr:type II toxin-antitoxin system PemK/MazF family toxin [Mesobacillus maritimus]MBY0098148.1 type II toxin-antitoxin system PemK/MazF family toxin [Mesobacillus maritimus]